MGKVSARNLFRAELVRLMPGYSWTVHKSSNEAKVEATGIQTSGFNRISTLVVTRSERDGFEIYECKSAGFGLRAKWLHTNTDVTLASSLRGLQSFYEVKANTYRAHAAALQNARKLEPVAASAPVKKEG